MALLVGVDAGGTNTVGVVSDESGRIFRWARAAGANLHVHGELGVEKVLALLLDELCPDERPEALCLGMAGVDRPGEDEVVKSMLRRFGFRGNAIVVNDAIIALAAGAPERVGVVVIAGTGSIAYGVDGRGRTARAGGLGPMLADEGSAGWIGHKALLAAVRAADGRGEATVLKERIFEALAIRSLQDLPGLAYGQGLTREKIAQLAPEALAAWQDGDRVACRIVDEAASELAIAASSVVHQLHFSAAPFPLIFAGGLFVGAPSLADVIVRKAAIPGAAPRTLDRDPAEGALLMALDLHRARQSGETRR